MYVCVCMCAHASACVHLCVCVSFIYVSLNKHLDWLHNASTDVESFGSIPRNNVPKCYGNYTFSF